MNIPFGKYKGMPIEEIPSYYLKWIAENFSEETEEKRKLVKACDEEYQWRENNNCHILTEGE